MIVIAVAAWLLGVQPQLKNATAADTTRIGVEAQNQTLSLDLVKLRKDFEDIDANRAVLDKLRVEVPSQDSLDVFLGQLDTMAKASGVSVSGFTSAPGTPMVEPADGSSKAPSGVDASNLLTLPLTMNVEGSRDQIMAFVGELQSGKRLMLVSDVSVQESNGVVTGNISGLVYVLLDTPLVTATPTPASTSTP